MAAHDRVIASEFNEAQAKRYLRDIFQYGPRQRVIYAMSEQERAIFVEALVAVGLSEQVRVALAG